MLLGSLTPDNSFRADLAINLREQFGVFRLAYLEALVRAADVQAPFRKMYCEWRTQDDAHYQVSWLHALATCRLSQSTGCIAPRL